jgi:hypothetical protein
MESTFLSEGQTMDLLSKASLIRWNENNIPSTLNLQNLLQPERIEDNGNSVWKIFNVIQEKFVRGGVQYSSKKGRMVTMKQLKNFQSINKINTSLWELADSYCN